MEMEASANGFMYAGLTAADLDDDGRPKRTGTLWTASAHIITAVIGSGVLSLAWSMAKLGWILGPITLLGFALITYYTSILLADCYRGAPHQPNKRNHTYMEAVQANLGNVHTKFCMVAQYFNLFGISTGYAITTSISILAISRSNCFHKYKGEVACSTSTYTYIKLFGALEILLSQIPNFSKLSILSIIAAIMSFTYSLIGIGLSMSTIIGTKHLHGTLGGSTFNKENSLLHDSTYIWPIFQALGNIAFAYSYTALLVEIQDTLKSPPQESETMKKANIIGISTTTTFYLVCGSIGYAAFGDHAPGNLLTGFYEPYWLVDLANACVVVHLVGAFQVFVQPIFAFVESWASLSFPKNPLIQRVYKIKMPFFKTIIHISLFRLLWRTAFVVFIMLVAMILPFFNDILGIIGALAFWPLTVYFPIQMYIARTQIKPWSQKWFVLQSLSFFCLLISLAGLAGSLQSVVKI